MKKSILLSFLLLSGLWSVAQTGEEENNNIFIKTLTRNFEYVKGNDANPVQVKEKTTRSFFCNSYRTNVAVTEFYNNMEKIDVVKTYIGGKNSYPASTMDEYYDANGIFYSDARVFAVQMPITKPGVETKVVVEKTVLDPHYFTNIFFTEIHPVEYQEINITVPQWVDVAFKEFNFSGYDIQKKVTQKGTDNIYTFIVKNLPAFKSEPNAPGSTYLSPHLLVLNKTAQPAGQQYTYFKTLTDQYKWYRQLVLQVDNDKTLIRQKAEEITQGITTEEKKVAALYQWVQDNIRYIAFEDGIAGFKPEKAQTVLQKKYGDCKGMANLLTELLLAVQVDARKCWIGTKHLAYDYSTPNLAIDNHMISVWMKNGKPVFLDATEKYIGMGELAERIQGRQVLIEDGDKYLLERVPEKKFDQNTAYEKRVLTVDGNNLKGKISQTWKGENKVWLLNSLNNIKVNKQEDVLTRYLSEGKSNFEISNLTIHNLKNYNEDLRIEYDVLWKNALTEFGSEAYLELDNRRELSDFKIDADKRKTPYWLDFKEHIVIETELLLPSGKKIETLPADFEIKESGLQVQASYKAAPEKLFYKKEIIFNQVEINPDGFKKWNQHIDQLKKFYNQQVVLKSK